MVRRRGADLGGDMVIEPNADDKRVAAEIYGAYRESISVQCVGCIAEIVARYRRDWEEKSLTAKYALERTLAEAGCLDGEKIESTVRLALELAATELREERGGDAAPIAEAAEPAN